MHQKSSGSTVFSPSDPKCQRFAGRRSERPEDQRTSSSGTRPTSIRYIHAPKSPVLLQQSVCQSVAPPTPPTLPNFLETTLIPCRFRSVGGVGGIVTRRAILLPRIEALELAGTTAKGFHRPGPMCKLTRVFKMPRLTRPEVSWLPVIPTLWQKLLAAIDRMFWQFTTSELKLLASPKDSDARRKLKQIPGCPDVEVRMACPRFRIPTHPPRSYHWLQRALAKATCS